MSADPPADPPRAGRRIEVPRIAVGVLGPLVVRVRERPVAITAARLRILLAALAMTAGREVSTDHLADVVWGDDLPAHPRRSLQTYVTRLRAALGRDLIATRPAGYLLSADPDDVDALRFGRLLDAAAAAPATAPSTAPSTAAARLSEALRLWRGDPFEGLDSHWLQHTVAPRLVERYLSALEQRVDQDLARGQHGELVAELTGLTARYPLRESLWARLLIALSRSGRPGEALARYETIRHRLADELGTDPSPQLQAVHAELLAGWRPDQANGKPPTSGLPGPAPKTGSAPAPTPVPVPPTPTPPAAAIGTSHPREPAMVPRQLPAVPHGFVGRAPQIDELDRMRDPTTVMVTAVGGMAGVGKTALALHVAHRLAHRFPDGQLFVDLHGYTPGVPPLSPATALDRMLRALGVPGALIPDDLDERAALFRTRVAGRRLLVVLDNAATERQVVPLVPGAPGCQVLITSRHRLTGLDAAHTITLDPLPPADAVTLFAHVAGERPLSGAPPDLLVRVVELCGLLPLGIRIAAARLRAHPAWTVSDLVERLSRQQDRLGELEAGERSVIAALDVSCRQLGADERRAYGLLGLHPGSDVDAYATAALTGTTVGLARRVLDRLLEVCLVQEHAHGRYRFHDLVRVHAAGSARAHGAQERTAAVDRLLAHYARTASVAMDVAYPYEPERRPPVPPQRSPSPPCVDRTDAADLLDTELPNLLATARYAVRHALPRHVVHLSSVLYRHLRTRGHHAAAETLHASALAAARTVDDHRGEQRALLGIGDVRRMCGQYGEAARCFRHSLAVAAHAGDAPGELDALLCLGHIDRMQNRYEQAAETYARALSIAEAFGHRSGEVETLLGIGHLHRRQGRAEPAFVHFARALDLARVIGHRPGELEALIGLGRVFLLSEGFEPAVEARLGLCTVPGDGRPARGRYEQAAAMYQHALAVAGDLGDRNWQFEALSGLADLFLHIGDPVQAVAHHAKAVQVAVELGQQADEARAHDGLAKAYLAMNRRDLAREQWQQALSILVALGTGATEEGGVTADGVRARLSALSAGCCVVRGSVQSA